MTSKAAPHISIKPTDCRTGYLLYVGGKLEGSYRSRNQAQAMADFYREQTQKP